MTHWIKSRFQRYRQRGPWDFCWRIALEGTVVTLIAVVILNMLGCGQRDLNLGYGYLLFVGVIVAPIVETLLFQSFPVWIARLCNARFQVQCAASIIPFYLAHAIEGVATGIAAGLICGGYLAFTYVHWRERSPWEAFWVTAVSHAIHNLIVISLAFVFGEI